MGISGAAGIAAAPRPRQGRRVRAPAPAIVMLFSFASPRLTEIYLT